MTKLRIGDFCEIRRGASPRPIASPEWFSAAGPGWVRIGDVSRSGKYLTATEQCLSPEGVGRSVRVGPGDVLLSVAASVGVTAIVQMDACIHDGWVVLRPRRSDVDTEFLYYLLTHVAPQIAAVGQTGAQKNINSDILRKWRVTLPPLGSQKLAASVLCRLDGIGAQLAALIAAKHLLKRGLMQQLLTGTLRFPEFAGESWEDHKIGTLLEEVSRPVEWDEDATYRLLSLRRRNGGPFFREERAGRDIKTKKLFTVRQGDFVLSRMQIVHGALSRIPADFDGFQVSGMYMALRSGSPDRIRTAFLHYLSYLPQMYRKVLLSCHGVHIEKMTFDARRYMRQKIRIPPTLGEQDRIVWVIDLAERELRALAEIQQQLELQKRGLMRRLLSGEVIVAPEACDRMKGVAPAPDESDGRRAHGGR
ncbi:MAG: restriction endonuclease subunit S [Longimicrobiales bacterium]